MNSEMDFEKFTKEENSGKRNKLNRSERQETKNESEIAKEDRKLQIFSDAIGDAEYYIGGGIGIELAEGEIKRSHGDIDIIIFKDEIDKVKRNLEEKGFIVTEERGGHSLDARNFVINDEEPKGENDVHIGIYVYEKDLKQNVAQQIKPDGSISLKFPLEYFDKNKQTVDYMGNELTIADLRLIISLKVLSDRPRDIKDRERIIPALKSKYSEDELLEMKNICKENIRSFFIAHFKQIFNNFLETDQKINGDNIYNYFAEKTKNINKEIKNNDYLAAVQDFIGKMKIFSSASQNREKAKKEFSEFIENNLESLSRVQNDIIDENLE